MSEAETPTQTEAAPEDAAPEQIAYAICAMSDIPSQKARGFSLVILDENGQEKSWRIFVVRWGRQVFGYVNKCPHDNANLDWERNQFLEPNYGIRIMCGKHGATFEIGTGQCVEGPCKGRALTPVRLEIIDNDICVLGVTLAEDDDEDEEEEAGAATP
jgi:nitrite reductase/ring-hydroxylating ferredoxin subunit